MFSYGKGKPSDTESLDCAFETLQDLVETGFPNISLKMNAVNMDLPAKAFIKNCVQYDVKHGCDRCETNGKQVQKVMTFPIFEENKPPLRTNIEFHSGNSSNQHRMSPIVRILTVF